MPKHRNLKSSQLSCEQKHIPDQSSRSWCQKFATAAGMVVVIGFAGCGYEPALRDYRPVVDSYTTDMAAYEADRGECISIATQAQVEYERQQKAKRESNLTIGLVIGAIAGAAIGSTTGDAGDGAVVGATMGALEGGLADTSYDPVTSPRKIVDRCMLNRGYELLNDAGKGA